MKIKKLFHWLYAILMFLPILVFLPNAFYYGFNENAQAQIKSVQEPIYYSSNVITQVSDLQVNHVYHWGGNSVTGSFTYGTRFVIFLDEANFYRVYPTSYIYNDYNYFKLGFNGVSPALWASNNGVGEIGSVINNFNFDFVILAISSTNDIQDVLSSFTYSDYQYLERYQNIDYSMSIIDSMAFAFDSTMNNSIFIWATNTFLNAPFEYISGLFGIAANNPINTLLSYWLSISIIWLVFDLIMYVPLLVHRWIDKGGID